MRLVTIQQGLRPAQAAVAAQPCPLPKRVELIDYGRIKPDLFEFHLSYSDMELKPDDFLQGTYPFEKILF